MFKDASKWIKDYNTSAINGVVATDEFLKRFDGQDAGFEKYIKSLDGAPAKMSAYQASIKGATIGTRALTVATGALNMALNMGTIMAVSFAISKVVEQIDKAIVTSKEAAERAKEIENTYKSATDSFKSNINTIEGLKDEFSELAKGVDENGKNIGLTADEYKRYHNIVSQIIDISPSLIKGYDEEGNALVNNNSLISEAIKLQKELNEQKKQEYLANGEDIFKDANSKIKNIKKQLFDKFWGGRDDIFNYMFGDTGIFSNLSDTKTNEATKLLANIIGVEQISKDNILDVTQGIVNNKEKIIELSSQQFDLSETEKQALRTQIDLLDIEAGKVDTAINQRKKYLSVWASTENSEWYNNLNIGYLDEFNDAITQIASDMSLEIEDAQVKVKSLGEDFVKIQDDIPTQEIADLKQQLEDGTISSEQYNEAILKHINAIDDLADKYQDSNPALAALLTLIADGYRDFSKLADDTNKAKSSFDGFSKSIKNVTEKLDLLKSAQKEIEDNHGLSIGTISSLIDKYKNLEEPLMLYLAGLKNESDIIKLLQQEHINESNAFSNSVSQKLAANEQFSQQILNDSTFQELAEKYGWDLDNFTTIANLKQQVSSSLSGNILSITDQNINNLANRYNVDLNNFKDLAKAKLEIAKRMAKADGGFIGSDGTTVYKGRSYEGLKTELRDLKLRNASGSYDSLISQIQNWMNGIDNQTNQINAINEISNKYSPSGNFFKKIDVNKSSPSSSGGSSYQNQALQNKLDRIEHLKAIDFYEDNELQYITDLENAQHNFAHTQKENWDLETKIHQAREAYSDRLLQDRLGDIEHKKTMDGYQNNELQYISDLEKAKNELADSEKEIKDLEEKIYQVRKKYAEDQKRLEEERVKALEKAEDAIRSLAELNIKRIKQEKDEEKKRLNEELDGLNKVYDARKRHLNILKEKRDYEKSMSDKNAAVAKINKELVALDGDNSASATKRKLELEEQLAERQTELDDFVYDHNSEMLEKQIENESNHQEDLINYKIKKIDEYLDDQQQLMSDSMYEIQGMNESLLQELIDWNAKYGSNVRSEVVNVWNEAADALKKYGSIHNSIGTLTSVDNQIINGVKQAPQTPHSSTSPSSPSSSYSAAQPTTTYTVKRGDCMWNIAKQQGISLNDLIKMNPQIPNPRLIYAGQQVNIPRYHTGIDAGYIGNVGNTNTLKLFQMLSKANIKPDEHLSILQNGELLFNQRQQGNMIKNLNSLIKRPTDTNSGINYTEGDIIINGNATKQTVGEIERIKREQLNEFKKMQNSNMRSKGFGLNARNLI